MSWLASKVNQEIRASVSRSSITRALSVLAESGHDEFLQDQPETMLSSNRPMASGLCNERF